MKDFTQFSAEDFAAHPDFIAWVQKPDGENHHFWTSWVASHPESRETIGQARRLVSTIHFRQYPVGDAAYQRVWHQIQKNKDKPVAQHKKVIPLRYRYGIAASLLILLSFF